MADVQANILVGSATISVGPYVSAGGAGTLSDLGAILAGGITFSRKTSYHDVISDHHLGILSRVKTADAWEVKVTCMESSLANLLIAFDQPNASLSGSTLRHNTNAQTNYKQVQIVGLGPTGAFIRTITVWRCAVVECGDIPFKKDGEQLLPLTFGVCQDLTVVTADQSFKVVDS